MYCVNLKERALALVLELNGKATFKSIMDTVESLEWENTEFLDSNDSIDKIYIIENEKTITSLLILLTDLNVYANDFKINLN